MVNNKTINIDAKIKPSEMLMCKYRLLFNNPWYGIMTGITILGLIYYISLFNRENIATIDFQKEVTSHFPGSVITIIFPVLIVSLLIKNYISNKKQFKGMNLIEMNYFFSDFGITYSWKTECNITWNNICKVKETKKLFLIFTVGHSLLLLPKRSFENNEQIKSLRCIFKEKLPKKSLSIKTRKN